MTGWSLRCVECGSRWVLKVSYDLGKMGRIYHYCRKCGANTFHEVEGRTEEGSAAIGERESSPRSSS